MTIKLDGQIVNTKTSNKVTYNPPKTTTKPKTTSYANAYAAQAAAYQRQQEEARRAQEAAQRAYAQQMQAKAAAYQKQQEQARRQAESQRLAQQAAQQKKLEQQKQFNQSRKPVTNDLQPIRLGQEPLQFAPSPNAAQQMMNNWYGIGPYTAQPDRWATTPQAQQMINNYQSMPQPDRWANNPTSNRYIQNFLDYKKQQDEQLRLLRSMSWQNGPAANFLFEGLGPPTPPGFYDTPTNTNTGTVDYSGWDDWGSWGGGGGYEYKPPAPEWWVEMVQWRI